MARAAVRVCRFLGFCIATVETTGDAFDKEFGISKQAFLIIGLRSTDGKQGAQVSLAHEPAAARTPQRRRLGSSQHSVCGSQARALQRMTFRVYGFRRIHGGWSEVPALERTSAA